MGKYTVRYSITVVHDVEIEADSASEARMKSGSDYFPVSEVLQSFQENIQSLDLSDAEVTVSRIFNASGQEV